MVSPLAVAPVGPLRLAVQRGRRAGRQGIPTSVGITVDDLGQPVDVHAPVENVDEALEALGGGVLLWVWVNGVLDETDTRRPIMTIQPMLKYTMVRKT